MDRAPRSLAADLTIAALLTAVYAAAGMLGLRLALVHPSVTAIWPASGIALAALLVLGYRFAAAIFLGGFLVNIQLQGPAISLGIAAGNTLEALGGAWLLDRLAGGWQALKHPRGVFEFALLGAFANSVIGATIGAASLWLGGAAQDNLQHIWLTWWLGDTVGSLLVAPPVILWLSDPPRRWTRVALLRSGLLFVLALMVGQALFGLLVFSREANYPISFVSLPLLVWVAFRFSQRETATATLILAAFAIWGTMQGFGPFITASDSKDRARHEAQLLLQTFLGLTSVTALALSAVVTERHRVEAALRQANDTLETNVRERTADLAMTNEAYAQEIERRRLVEQSLLEEKAQFRTLLETVPDALVIVNSKGSIVLVNARAEKLFGHQRAELLGQPLDVLIPERYRARHHQHMLAYFREPSVRAMGVGLRLFALRRDGAEVPVEISLSPLRAAGEPLVCGAIRDISARAEIEEKLRQTERLAAIGEMMAGLAHESRTALQQSTACLELLSLKIGARPDVQALVHDIRGAQDRLHHLYEAVRSYAAPIRLRLNVVPVGALVADVWQQLAVARQGREARLLVQAADDALAWPLDALAFGQVVRNLFENSLSACADPVEVTANWTVATLQGVPFLELTIADNGPGLVPEARQKMFQPFFTTKTKGTGLGLAIAKRIVEAHGGRIGAGPDTGHGAEIVIVLPKTMDTRA